MQKKLFKHSLTYEQSRAFEFNNDCKCGAKASPSYIFRPDLLEGPIESKCMRHTLYDQISCFNEWAIAIPLGYSKERAAIERLVRLGHERDRLLDRLKEIEDEFVAEGKKNDLDS